MRFLASLSFSRASRREGVGGKTAEVCIILESWVLWDLIGGRQGGKDWEEQTRLLAISPRAINRYFFVWFIGDLPLASAFFYFSFFISLYTYDLSISHGAVGLLKENGKGRNLEFPLPLPRSRGLALSLEVETVRVDVASLPTPSSPSPPPFVVLELCWRPTRIFPALVHPISITLFGLPPPPLLLLRRCLQQPRRRLLLQPGQMVAL